jgi:signal peptidase II
MDVILIAFLAGAIGNCIDRVARGYVVDFFYFCLIDFPIFNVADIYVTLSAFFMLVLGLFYYKEDDFELVFSKGTKEEQGS